MSDYGEKIPDLRKPMTGEQRARMKRDFDEKGDLYTQCPLCKARLSGSMRQIMGHECWGVKCK